MNQLRGTTAIVTGSSRGIGLAIAIQLAGKGVNLALNGRDQGRLEKAAQRVRALGVDVVSVAGDITAETVRDELVTRTLEAFGSIEILINNAGIEPLIAFDAQSPAAIVCAIDLNYTATVLLTHQVLPHMLANRHGHIVAVASTMGLKGQPYGATYSGTKAAQIKWAEALRVELRDSGIGVSVVCPGIVAGAGIVGELTNATGIQPPRTATVTSHQVAEAVVKAIETNARQLIVQPGPLRTLLALDTLCPASGDAISRALGVEGYMRKLGEFGRERAR